MSPCHHWAGEQVPSRVRFPSKSRVQSGHPTHPSSSPSYIVLGMFVEISEICYCLTCVWNSMHSSNIELRNTCYQVNVVCLNSYIVLGMFVERFDSCYCLTCVWNSMRVNV